MNAFRWQVVKLALLAGIGIGFFGGGAFDGATCAQAAATNGNSSQTSALCSALCQRQVQNAQVICAYQQALCSTSDPRVQLELKLRIKAVQIESAKISLLQSKLHCPCCKLPYCSKAPS
jgi:hypothetical protein